MNVTWKKSSFLVFVLVFFVSAFKPVHGGWRNNPVTVSGGQFNPEFTGVKFGRFVVAAINVPPDYRKELELITATRIGRYKKDKWRGIHEDAAIAFRKLFPEPNFQPEKKYDVQFIRDKIRNEKIDILVLINILNEGGENLEDVESYVTALQLSGNYIHNITPVKKYRFAKITLFDTQSGKRIWIGDGIVKAKPGTTNWYNASAQTLAKHLIKHLEKAGVLAHE